jgi:hypothetical protein
MVDYEHYDPPQNFSDYFTLDRRNIAKGVNLHQRSLASMPSVRGYILEWSTTGSLFLNIRLLSSLKEKCKRKAVPVQAWADLEGSTSLGLS